MVTPYGLALKRGSSVVSLGEAQPVDSKCSAHKQRTWVTPPNTHPKNPPPTPSPKPHPKTLPKTTKPPRLSCWGVHFRCFCADHLRACACGTCSLTCARANRLVSTNVRGALRFRDRPYHVEHVRVEHGSVEHVLTCSFCQGYSVVCASRKASPKA